MLSISPWHPSPAISLDRATAADLHTLAHHAPPIPIYEGPLRGPARNDQDHLQYGQIEIQAPGNRERDYQHARDYLTYGQYHLTPEQDGVAKEIHVNLNKGSSELHSVFLMLEDGLTEDNKPILSIPPDKNSPDPIRLHISDRFPSASKQVYGNEAANIKWPSRKAIMTPDGKGISGAMRLGHELIQ
jgi:hypothetical protein